jgi:hypothetical protein
LIQEYKDVGSRGGGVERGEELIWDAAESQKKGRGVAF